MAGEVKKLDFFKTKRTTPTTQPTQAKAVADTPAVAEPVKKAPLMQKKEQAINTAMHIEGELSNMLTETADLFNKVGLKTPAAEIKQLLNELNRKRFSVAVVGEFSRGKSTFINNLFAREMLPVGNTPTTAMLTRIRYNEKPMLVVANGKGKKSKPMPLVEESWDGLVADLYGNDPFGVAFVGVNSDWLKGGLEIIDTPGAGDLEAKRALIIGDALRGSDGAIIAVSADTPMSLSEQVFVKERLISMKTPFLMLVITKLDRIPENERDRIVDFIKTKLDMWKSEWKTEMVSANGEGAEDWDIDIPIYVPGEVSMPTDKYKDIIGMDKVKAQINSWVKSPEREQLTKEWIVGKAEVIINGAIDMLREKMVLIDSDEDSRRELIIQKEQLLEKAAQGWEDIRVQMNQKGMESCRLLDEKAQEYKTSIIERLQYELSHSNDPKKWWNEDYPYKLKLEMTNMSSQIENVLSRKISEDVRWLNANLDKSFKTHVLFSQQTVADRASYTDFTVRSNQDLGDLTKARTKGRIGISALTVVGFCAFSSLGIPPIIASMGVGTGGSIISETFFKKKIEAQRDELKKAIERNVPSVIEKAMINSETRIKKIYSGIIDEANNKEISWMNAQKEAIRAAVHEKSDKSKETYAKIIEKFENELNKIKNI